MTSGVDTSIEHIAKVLSGAELELTEVSHQLELHFSRAYSSSRYTNVYNLVQRLRTVQKDIDDLLLESNECDQQRWELMTICRDDLRSNFDFAKQAHAYGANEDGDPSMAATYTSRLSTLESNLMQVLRDSNKANNLYLETFDPIHKPDTRGSLQSPEVAAAATPSHTEGAQGAMEQYQGVHNENGAAKSTSPKLVGALNGSPSVANKTCHEPSKVSNPVASSPQGAPESSKKSFEPISKAAFNRLPRNIKIKAGKLPDVNSFYEKVCSAFSEKGGGPLSDKQLLQATGESKVEKLDVLRGLSVLRKNKQGWVLV